MRMCCCCRGAQPRGNAGTSRKRKTAPELVCSAQNEADEKNMHISSEFIYSISEYFIRIHIHVSTGASLEETAAYAHGARWLQKEQR
jgi:hypothetical protein